MNILRSHKLDWNYPQNTLGGSTSIDNALLFCVWRVDWHVYPKRVRPYWLNLSS